MRTSLLIAMLLLPLAVRSTDVNLSGKVYGSGGKPLFGVDVSLQRARLSTSTRPDGSWSLTGSVNSEDPTPARRDTLLYRWKDSSFGAVSVPSYSQTSIAQVVRTGQGDDEQDPSDMYVEAACRVPGDSSQQQGKYKRQSVSHLGNLVLRGGADALTPMEVGQLQANLLEHLRLRRFDDNPLPGALTETFDAIIQGRANPSDEQISNLIDRTLVPAVMDVLRLRGMERAENLAEEYRKHTAYHDKMKGRDITADQLRSVMNAAWIYVPIVDNVNRIEENGGVSTIVSMTLLWYHIVCDTSADRLRARLERIVKGEGRSFYNSGKGVDAFAYTFQGAARSCIRTLLTKTRDIPEFNLSGQVLEATDLATTLDVGKREGVRPNEQFYLMENRKDSSGSTRQVQVGWVKIYGVSGSDSIPRSRARVVSGKPYPGLVLKEAPVSGLSLELGYVKEPVRIQEKEKCAKYQSYSSYDNGNTYSACRTLDLEPKSTTLSGLQFGAMYSIPWWYGLQLGVGTALLFGDQNVMDLSASLRQSVPIYHRLSAYIEPEIAARLLLGAESRSDSGGLPPAISRTGIRWGLEFAVTPNFGVRAYLGSSDIGGKDYSVSGTKTEMKSDGGTFGVLLQWSLKSSAVDPLDMMVGIASIAVPPQNGATKPK